MINPNRIRPIDLFALFARSRCEPQLVSVEKADDDDIWYNTVRSIGIIEIQLPIKKCYVFTDDKEDKDMLESIFKYYGSHIIEHIGTSETHDFYYIVMNTFISKICSFILNYIIKPIWEIEFWITYDGTRWLSDLLIKDPRAPKKKYKWQ